MGKSKKQLILEYCRERGIQSASIFEIRSIQAALGRQLGPNERPSLSYIANVLRRAGAHVDFNDRYVDPLMGEPYATRLQGLLQFRDLKTAEIALRRLDEAHREYERISDRTGAKLVRSLVLKGKQRAESLAASPRVNAARRAQKREIADWFRVWLETPDIFFDWLELRKCSEEFQRLFGVRPETSQHFGSDSR